MYAKSFRAKREGGRDAMQEAETMTDSQLIDAKIEAQRAAFER